ncbi:MAG TPA: hypothetical protein VGM03_09255 [Phycisphaerae bacterium]
MFSALLASSADRVRIERRLEFAAVPEGWLALGGVVLLALLCWAVVWLYRREARRGASPRVRTVLAVLRCLVLVLCAVVALQPIIATYITRWIDSYTVVLVDESASMDLRDAPDVHGSGGAPQRRLDQVDKLLSSDQQRFLRGLTANNRTSVYGFSDAPKLLYTLRAAGERGDTAAQSGAHVLSDVTAARTEFAGTGAASDISRAVHRSVEGLGGAPIAGIVVLSDGAFNAGDPADAVARYAREHNLPIYTVGFGDPSPPRSIRITELLAPTSAFKNDPYALTVNLTAQGLTGETRTVELYERSPSGSGGEAPVASKIVTVSGDGALSPLTFERRQETSGRWVYSAQVAPQPGDSAPLDQVQQAAVNVVENKTRVLLVSGGPSWDYRFLTRLLERDPSFDVSCWLQSADDTAVRDGDIIIDHLPTTPEELFRYDVVVLMDVDPREIDARWSELVAKMVTEHGGGVLYTAARTFTPAFMRDPAAAPLVQMLPVTIDPEADLILNQIGHYQQQPASIEIPSGAFGHPILRQGDDPAAGKLAWTRLGKIFWHYPVLRSKPVATTLMTHGDPRMRNTHGAHVLLATHYVGAGRAAFLGFDGTWRWRQYGTEFYDRFWIQMLRYLIEGKLLGGHSRGVLLTDSDSYPAGEAVAVSARLYDERFEPETRDTFAATYHVENETREFVLQRAADRPGWYEGRFVPDRAGLYDITLVLRERGSGVSPDTLDGITLTRQIQVVRSNLEMANPRMNREALVTLAEQSAGGRYFDPADAARIPDLIPDRHESTTIKGAPTLLWDRWWTLALLVGLLSVEWTVRKLARLL